MSSVQAVLDRYATGVPYEALARGFLSFERWTGDDPRLLVAEAAASTTGQRFVGGIEPAVSRFRAAFVETDRVESLADLATIDCEDDDLIAAFGAERKRHVLVETASVLADRSDGDDLATLRDWAAKADHYRYDEDPIGKITGIGPSSFQYLRQLAGVDAARADPTMVAFVDRVAADIARSDGGDSVPLSTADARRTIASCEWLALSSSFRPIELDRIAWWLGTDPADRETAAAVHAR
ncbi:hypothetical protein [Natrarchaeobaculum sulfurireducens]|uniref:Uncharacterized protein n=1 Tax=Natrarchaeobaculum sulfurireducens TaxID=2044521 RepID=A0A346PHV7_9EURY|nr:hypothetical protein [Natrarchaeobaculum sulfurireducens]AXR79102.1 hypothetical protein AArc1_2790 [Natrarchaeobaculum sulfurireducens]